MLGLYSYRAKQGRLVAVVLIVEDDTQVRLLAEAVLQGAGYETRSASTRAEAQALLASDQPFDALFTDISLFDEREAGLDRLPCLKRLTAARSPSRRRIRLVRRSLSQGRASQLRRLRNRLGRQVIDLLKLVAERLAKR